jgi:hypothetical protein
MSHFVDDNRGKLVPAPVLAVLEKLRQMFGDRFQIISAGPERSRFYVDGMTDARVIQELELRRNELFGSNGSSFQVLCSLQALGERGLELHYMPAVTTQQTYAPGCWFM